MNRSRLLALVVPALLLPALGWAAGGARTERLRALATKLSAVEGQLNATDQASLDRQMDHIEKLLNGYQAVTALTCVSNGQPGSSERFLITETATGAAVEQPTSLATCKQ